jgi:hypothetical protein
MHVDKDNRMTCVYRSRRESTWEIVRKLLKNEVSWKPKEDVEGYL